MAPGLMPRPGSKGASKIKSLRFDRIEVLRARLEEDITELLARAEAADNTDSDDGLSLPDEIARRQNLKAKLDAAAKRLKDAAHRENDGNRCREITILHHPLCPVSPCANPGKRQKMRQP